jgi:glyoxylase-like metal-dependent hydrolase (beta-lactamase superfamily II)
MGVSIGLTGEVPLDEACHVAGGYMAMCRVALAGALTVLVVPGPCLAQVTSAASLSGLELAADKTDIERFRIPLNEAFTPSRLDYTVTVDESYTAHVLITPRVSPEDVGSLEINGADVRPNEPHQVGLRPGANTFAITLEPKQGAIARTYRLTVTQKDLSKEYRSQPLGKGVWRIRDFGGFVGNEDMYLFEGKDRALLLDTGMGRGDLAGYVRSLTSLPVDVAITHGNRDHFLQVDQFPGATVYMSEKDVTRLPPGLVTPRFKWVKDGDVIDIGAGRRFEVAEVPGHSLGSVLYVDFANKAAITGDAISSGSMVYVFAPTCTALDQYLEALKKLEARISGQDGLTLLVGHHYQEKTPLTGRAGKQLITDMRTAVEKVLRGELEGNPARTVRDGRAIELRQATVGLAGLWYNPKNLVTDPAALGFLDVRTAAGQPVIPRPVFSSLQTSYTATVAGDVQRVVVTPTAYDPRHRRITINGTPAASGEAFTADLGGEASRFEIAVTAANDSVRTYAMTIARQDVPRLFQ